MPLANNKGTDQPAHLRSLISTFIVRCLESTICIFVLSKVSRPKLVSVAEQAGLSLTWSQTPKTGFLVTRLTFDGVSDRTGKPTLIPKIGSGSRWNTLKLAVEVGGVP